MDFPKLRSGQYAVIAAEVQTGIVLNSDVKRWLDKDGAAAPWKVFDSLVGAREFAIAEVARNPLIEINIYDNLKQWIQVIRSQ
jgi:hypothetical protein